MRIYLDMDGVICNFNKGILKAHGIEEDPHDKPENLGKFELGELLGMTPAEFFAPCGHDFYANLEWEPGGKDLFSILTTVFGEKNITLVTSPTNNIGCGSGKREWAEKNLGKGWRRKTCCLNNKEEVAHPNAVLIDDKPSNITKFLKAGGLTVLYPQRWNLLHGFSDVNKRLIYVSGALSIPASFMKEEVLENVKGLF